MSWGDFIGKMAVPVAIGVVFAASRRYMPAKAAEGDISESVAEAASGRSLIVNCGIGLFFVVFLFGMHVLLVWMNYRYALMDGSASFRLFPQTAIWWFFPGFAGISLAYEIVLQIWSFFGSRSNAMSYDEWSSQKTGFDARRVLRWMALLVAGPIGIFTLLAVPMHVSLGGSTIVDHGFGFGQPKVYYYADAQKLTMIEGFKDRDGKLTRRAGLVLSFKDGRRWSSAESGNFRTDVDPELTQFLQQKTGLPVEVAETASDIQ